MSKLLDLGARERRRVVVLQRSGLPVRIVIAPSPDLLASFRSSTHLSGPGVYIGLWDDEVYVGASSVTRSRACRRSWRYRSDPPKSRIAIIPTHDDRSPSEGLALERIVWSAVASGVRVQNSCPAGAVVTDERYAHLQGTWAAARWLLADVAPALARPWPGPACLADGPLPPAEIRLRAESCGASVTVHCLADERYIVEPGSIFRRDPLRACGPRIAIVRQELRHAGCLAPHGEAHEILTRPIRLNSLSAVRNIVFSQRGSGWGWSPEGGRLPLDDRGGRP